MCAIQIKGMLISYKPQFIKFIQNSKWQHICEILIILKVHSEIKILSFTHPHVAPNL